ncbi:type 2 GTP cyclohydrolase I [Sodalis sp. CWE]|uniref:type 2 GTP cyclohydrolase I n=1 Tax=Sodalis sp. CWE TaxID=2803816 RepID=UPI001C7CD11B|nr:type 2 GTP cyclohydrolase I [Sodalis sp. CWE]MBX4180948.1 type 2 GTP cyclohydrolase I [Sodalis sp. CWE]
MHNNELEHLINQKLNNDSMLKDYLPNGLQVEGRQFIQRIVTGVTACQALLDSALTQNADAIIVHHGYFWKNETSVVRGIKRCRLKTLLANDINLYAWHLPLDIHPELGNNTQLAIMLDIQITGSLNPFVLQGELLSPINGDDFRRRIEEKLGHNILQCSDNAPLQIKRLAWCTGNGQQFIELAAQAGVDAFITGEVSEQTIHIAREYGVHFYAAGHHVTERGGILALGDWLSKQCNLNVVFIDIPNPA